MVSKIGSPQLTNLLQSLERKGIRISDFATSEEVSEGKTVIDREALQDWVDVHRDGDLDPESLQLIDEILAEEDK